MTGFVQVKPMSDTGSEWVAIDHIVSVKVAHKQDGKLIVTVAKTNGQTVDVTDESLAPILLGNLGITPP